MKQPISRSPFQHPHGTVAVYLQEGAPLTDAVWNEAIDTAWTNLRGAILDGGMQGSAGLELRVDPVHDPVTGKFVDLLLRGGPGRFYSNGLPIAWPADLRLGQQSCACTGDSLLKIFERAKTEPVFVWVESRSVLLDEHDLPEFRDPAVQSDRGSFRRAIRSCVRVAEATAVPGALAAQLQAIEAVAPHLEGLALETAPAATNVRLTVQGAYASDENVHYHVEMVRWCRTDNTHDHIVELLWDDRAASTVARLVSDAGANALAIEVDGVEGFEEGQFIRLEGHGVDDQIYVITRIDGYKLEIQRSLCCEVKSLESVPIVAQQVRGDPANPASLEITLVVVGGDLIEGDLVTKLTKGSKPLPFAELTWRVVGVAGPNVLQERTIELVPHFGLTEALSPWGAPLALMHHARIHEHCIVVEDAACWQPGMKIRISGRPRKQNADDPCWRPEEIDDGYECWPTREPLFKDEDRTIAAIERCGTVVECCDDKHTTMTLRLDIPLSADHSKCCDVVRPAREIKVRRYAGHECHATLRAVWPCCAETGGVCCLKPSFTLPSGLDVVLTYRGGTSLHFEAGDAWSFAARAGGWYQGRVFAPPDEVLLGITPLAMIVPGGHKWPVPQYFDLRPIPAGFDQTGLLADIHQSCAELAVYFKGQSAARLRRAADLAAFPRLQANVRHGKFWQYGLAETLYSVARDAVQTFQGLESSVEPKLLATHPLLALAFKALANATVETRHKPALTNRELSTIASALRRAASSAAALLGGCCGEQADLKSLQWPTLLPLVNTGPKGPPLQLALPTCPDEKPAPQRPEDPGEDPISLPGMPLDLPGDDPIKLPGMPLDLPGDDPIKLPGMPLDLPGDDPIKLPGMPLDIPGDDPIKLPGMPLDIPGDDPIKLPGMPLDIPGDDPIKLPGMPLDIPGDDPISLPGMPLDIPDSDPIKLPGMPLDIPGNDPISLPGMPLDIPDPDPISLPGLPLDLPDPEREPGPRTDLPVGMIPPDPVPDVNLPSDKLLQFLPGPAEGGASWDPTRLRSILAEDLTIGAVDPAEAADPPDSTLTHPSDVGIAELLADDPGEPDMGDGRLTSEHGVLRHDLIGTVDFMQLATDKLRILQSLNPSTAHKIAADWPTLADVYTAHSDGAVRKQVIANVQRIVLELRALLARGDTSRSLDVSVQAIASRYLRDIELPPAAVLARQLPAPPNHEEE